jgi:drug/metabolite transporter (DMT)-like permease
VKSHWVGPLALLGAAAIWGFVPVTTRYIIGTLAPLQIMLARFVIASLIAGVLLLTVHPPLPSRRHLPRTIWLGVLGTLGFGILLTYGIRYVEAGTAALLTGLSPLFTVVLAGVFLGEQLRPRMLVGLLIALSGTVIVATVSGGGVDLSREQLLGSGLIALSSLLWAYYSVAAKPWLGTAIPPTSIPMLGALASLPLVAPFGAGGIISALGELNLLGWLSVGLFTVGATVFAPMLYAIGLQRGAASRAGIYSYLAPLFGLAASTVLLGEPIGAQTIAGGALILVGVLLATLSPSVAAVRQVVMGDR